LTPSDATARSISLYEDIVESFESTVHRILEFCGLEPEAECLHFHDTRRAISTASSEQVRQPIVRTELTRWRQFEPWLGPLRELLGPRATAAHAERDCASALRFRTPT
jgi:hypothetical protein